MKKVLKGTLLFLLIVALMLTLFSCSTAALWQEQREEERDRDATIGQANGSERYIVYAALDSSGNLIPSDSETATAAYAVVGYIGMVAELVIPATYKDATLNASACNVTKVLVCDADGTSYGAYKCSVNGAAYTGNYDRLVGNTVVTSIVFGSNVTYVGDGVCVGMVNVTSVKFASTTFVTLGQNAFAACPAITSVSFSCAAGNVTLNGNFAGLTPTYAS